MTQVYFALNGPKSSTTIRATFDDWDWANNPVNVLIAFPFISVLDMVEPDHNPWAIKSLMLDSGAYSVANSGHEVDFEALCKEAANPKWSYVAALDVIGNGLASMKNAFAMKARGLQVIPVFHYGEPWEILAEYKAHFPYIGLGCKNTSTKVRLKWIEQCFARVWPHRVHMFGCGNFDVLRQVPFYSADTSSWYSGIRFGRSAATPRLKIPPLRVLGKEGMNLQKEVKHYLALQRDLEHVWAKELAQLGATNEPS